MLFRVIVKFRLGSFLVVKDFNKRIFLVKINDISRKFKNGQDYYFYASVEKKFYGKFLVPMSDEEAGVVC